MELCLRRRLSGGRWTAVDKSSPDWRWLQAKWLSGHYRDTLSGTPTSSSALQHKPSGKSWIISRHNRIMFLYCIVVVPIPGGCGWCGCRDKISFCKQSKFVPAQCPHTLPTAPSSIMWGTTAANNIYRVFLKMGSKHPQQWIFISRRKLIPV